jgi:hypothetical protein
MKKNIAVLVIIVLCMATASSAFARGRNHGHHGGYSNGYHHRSNHYDYRGSRHHRDGLGIAIGVAGGLILGSALISSANPPPPTVVYAPPYPAYQPEVVVLQPRI